MKGPILYLFLLFIAGSAGLRSAPAGPPPPPAAPCDAGRIRAELARQISEHFNLEGDLEVEFLRPWSPPSQLASSWEVMISEYPNIASGLMVLRFQVIADGVPQDEESLMVRASLWRDVWFARQPVTAGSIFNPAMLDVQRVDCFRTHDSLPASAGDRSLVFARDVPADRMLTWHDLARRPLVKKGDLVEATAREGELFVSMKALALENGANGDIITLRNLESHNEFSGQVVDDNRVEIRF